MELEMNSSGDYGLLWAENWGDLDDAINAHAEAGGTAQAVDHVVSCDLIWPSAGKLRVRKVVSRRGHRSTRKYPSMKAGRMVQCESSHESDLVKLLELCTAVTSLAEQPVRIRYRTAAGVYSHVPDFVIRYRRRAILLEVKDDVEANSSEVLQRTRQLIPALGVHGFGYVVLTPRIIGRKHRLANTKTLLRLGRGGVSALERERVRRFLLKMGHGACWGGARAADLRCQVARLVLQGDIEMPLNQALNDRTPLYWCDRRA